MSITEQDMVEMGYAHQIRRDAVATKLVAEPEHLIIMIIIMLMMVVVMKMVMMMTTIMTMIMMMIIAKLLMVMLMTSMTLVPS